MHHVCIVMGYELDGLSCFLGRGKKFFFPAQHLDWLWGPRSLLSSEYGVKQPGSEANDSPPSHADMKNGGTVLEFSCVFMLWYVIS
jgi:hypothetical protein